MMNNTIPGTVCCLLCRGAVIFKGGDRTRFVSHMQDNHGAFFELDYLLASCLMGEGERQEVSARLPRLQALPQFEPDHTFATEQQPTAPVTPGPAPGEFSVQENSTIESKPKPYSCPNCSKSFVSLKRFENHCNKQHSGDTGSGPVVVKQERPVQEEPGRVTPDRQYFDQFLHPSSFGAHQDQQETAANQEKIIGLANHEESSFDTSDVSGMSDESAVDISTDMNESKEELRASGALKRSAEEEFNNGEDEVFLKDEKAENKIKAERFRCEVENCDKSYTAKNNLDVHKNKKHGIFTPRQLKKQKMSTTSDVTQADTTLEELEQKMDEVDTKPTLAESCEEFDQIHQQLLSSTCDRPRSTFHESEPSSFLTDPNLGFEHETEDPSLGAGENLNVTEPRFEFEENQVETAMPKAPLDVDLSKSKYFVKNPKSIVMAIRGKSLALFDQVPNGLPNGWKMRTNEGTSKATGEKMTIRHYLTPDCRVLKTALGAVEYIRLTTSEDMDQLAKYAKALNVSEKKFKNLFE